MHKEITNTQIIKRNLSISLSIKTFILISLATIISIKFLDTGIAVGVMHILQTVYVLKKATKSIPDFLPHFVGIGTLFLWAFYFYRLHEKKFDKETRFLRLAGTVLPVAYLVKTLIKFVFGRTSPRSWLINNQPLTFHWFKTWDSSFPSGHMVVFAAFGTAIVIHYPQYRKPVLIFLFLLGAALVGTDYHFLSDVIAGTYIGIITTYLTWILLIKRLTFS
ncbi:MAG: phosphatase PAP2 family protein [Ignavibacteriaceae bacterium]